MSRVSLAGKLDDLTFDQPYISVEFVDLGAAPACESGADSFRYISYSEIFYKKRLGS